MAERWTDYIAGNAKLYVPVEKWGRDHWSTLAYLYNRAIDYDGIIDGRRMRCDPRLHREFVHLRRLGNPSKKYPTRLRNGELDGHDDWSCLEDMVAADLVLARYRVKDPTSAFGNSEAKVIFTEAGHAVMAKLNIHKAGGGNFGTFVLEQEEEDERPNRRGAL